jgi:hypothetical protein
MMSFTKIRWLLKTRPAVRTARMSFVGLVLSFVSDFTAVFNPTLLWLVLACFVLLVVVVAWSSVRLTRHPLGEIQGWASMKDDDRKKEGVPPSPLSFGADAMLFLFVTLILSCATAFGGALLQGGDRSGSKDAQGLYATLVPAIARAQQSLNGIERDVSEIKTSLKKVKLETSEDPRKELANLGVSWNGENFLAAVRAGDLRIVKLFLDGDIDLLSAESDGRPLPILLSQNPNAGPTLDLLIAEGLDPNWEYALPGGLGPRSITLVGWAIEKGNLPMLRAAIQHGADLNREIQGFGAMGSAIQTYPLALSVRRKQFEMVTLLLDGGADPGAGDYAAYRELRALVVQAGSSEPSAELLSLEKRLAPSDSAGERISMEVRLGEVEQELNQVALKSLRAVPGSADQIKYDRLYDELQQERQQLQHALGISQ